MNQPYCPAAKVLETEGPANLGDSEPEEGPRCAPATTATETEVRRGSPGDSTHVLIPTLFLYCDHLSSNSCSINPSLNFVSTQFPEFNSFLFKIPRMALFPALNDNGYSLPAFSQFSPGCRPPHFLHSFGVHPSTSPYLPPAPGLAGPLHSPLTGLPPPLSISSFSLIGPTQQPDKLSPPSRGASNWPVAFAYS